MPRARSVRVRYPDVVLVCRECNGDGKRIAKELKRAVRAFAKRPRVMRTSCLDVEGVDALVAEVAAAG